MSLMVVEIGAGGCPGDSHEGCYHTDLPGDQLTGTLPIEVHAGRSELLQEHVDLVVQPRTSRPKFPPSQSADAFDQVIEPLITEIT